MGFPLQINGRTYTKDDFEGLNYVAGIPSLATDFVTKTGNVVDFVAKGQNNGAPGRKFFYTEKYAPVYPGMRVMLVNTTNSLSLYGRVLEYTPSTGYLCINALSFKNNYSILVSSYVSTVWTLRINGAQQDPGTAPVTIANGGTAGTDFFTARKNLSQQMPAKAYTVFEDFIGSAFDTGASNNLCYPWGYVGNILPQDLAVITQDRQGIAVLTANAITLNTCIWWWQGNSANITTIGGFIGCGTVRSWFLEWMVYLPVLSSAINRYTLQAGISGIMNTGVTGSNNAYFSYSDSLNAGQWQVATEGSSAVLTTASSASAVAATTWYKLRMTYTPAGGIVFSVNGVNIATVNTAAILPAAGQCTPFLRITRGLGTGGAVDVDYMQYYGT